MVVRITKRLCSRLALILMILTGTSGAAFSGVRAERSTELNLMEKECAPGTGWMWIQGSTEPAVAAKVPQELSRRGIQATVEARNYGEADHCGTYHSEGIDFTIHLQETKSAQTDLADAMAPVLTQFGKPKLGNVKLISSDGKSIPMNFDNQLPVSSDLQTE